ncbi:MAG TPA: TIGR03118 family protein [Bryobacteraceae bacterium]|nr:TIGR03118 family protein [Bryobacteraceae bacterium]
MKPKRPHRGLFARRALPLLLMFLPSLVSAATIYNQTNLVSDIPGMATHTDANLVNPWGMSSSASSPMWVSNAGTSTSTLYNGQGTPQALVVNIPPPSGGSGFSGPTGQVFNSGSGFELNPGQPARFLFATLSGTIAGWNPAANPTSAITKIDNSAFGAIYTGLASAGDVLYAANFSAGAIDAFDAGFNPLTLQGSFSDPNLPAGYSPFNIQNVGGELYVMYALFDPDEKEEVKGAGLGYVNVFDASGNLLRRFVSNGPLNAPWGVAMAPASFGDFGGKVLVGNFGDGTIHAFEPSTGMLLGAIQGRGGSNIVNEGLWAIRFGNGGNGGDVNKLYFAAGIDDEEHGLFGSIAPVPEPGTLTVCAGGLLVLLRLRRRVKR